MDYTTKKILVKHNEQVHLTFFKDFHLFWAKLDKI